MITTTAITMPAIAPAPIAMVGFAATGASKQGRRDREQFGYWQILRRLTLQKSGGGPHRPVPFGLLPPPAAGTAAGASLPSLLRVWGRGGCQWDEVPLGRFVRTLLRQLIQELLKSGTEFPVYCQRLHPAQLIELPLPRPHAPFILGGAVTTGQAAQLAAPPKNTGLPPTCPDQAMWLCPPHHHTHTHTHTTPTRESHSSAGRRDPRRSRTQHPRPQLISPPSLPSPPGLSQNPLACDLQLASAAVRARVRCTARLSLFPPRQSTPPPQTDQRPAA
jgi:hypothetical protein